ncbi:unnamed protein product [Chironomus riparius]|uniref:Uncharacterized protein n=1 Tax=Chironomus riparius TaxID=315576 RepID=A0A9N9RXK0_9DIPT|nr:unnamed protein product [Chironomus riparius]
MLIAPIFKVDYLSKQNEPHNSKIKDVSANVHNNPATTSTYSNIFKTALNRGTELIKSTFLSKSTNFYNDSFELSTNVVNQASLPVKLDNTVNIERSSSESSSSSSSTSSSSDHSSSPDSIKTELMLFKPIVREPRITSSTKILRPTSIRSTSSNSTIHTPSPSPFFIPITSQRQSAFSVVIHLNDTIPQKEIKKPKSVKRNRSNCENKKSEGFSPKRQKVDRDSTYNTRLKTDKDVKVTRSTAKTKNQPATKVLSKKQKGRDTKAKAGLTKTNEFRRVTRSMKKT